MRKILIVTSVAGFLEKFCHEDVKALRELGYEVHCATNMCEVRYPDAATEGLPGVCMHQIGIAKSPFRLISNFKAVWAVKKIIREEGICMVHSHSPTGGIVGRLAGAGCGITTLYTAHGFHFYQGAPVPGRWVYYLAERLMARLTDVIFVINHEDYESVLRFRLKKGGSVYRIPSTGLDRERFLPLDVGERREARRRLGIGEDAFFLVSVGELNRNKNHAAALRALARMRRSGTCPARFCYGICGEGPEREYLERLAGALGLADAVRFYGYRSDIREIVGSADVFVFPSRREGMGMAALEALSLGVPVVAADNRGTREYMENGKNGFVCRWDDPAGYQRGIEKIYAMGGPQRREMGRQCQRTAGQFQAERALTVLRRAYRALWPEIQDG